MSSERNSSAVRNLRSIFENKASLDSSSPDSRGRSPSGVGGSDKENGSRPRSKIRASFVPVELAGMATATADSQGTAGLRRGSFSEVDGDGALSELKRTVSEQQGQRLVPEGAVESAAGSVAATPNKKPGEGRLGHDMPPENPDKAVTGQQESSDMKPADPSSEKAVSGGDALPPVAEDLRTQTTKAETKKPTTNGKPAAISTNAAPRASSNAVKSPAAQPKTPTSTKVSTSSTNAASTLSPSHKAPVKKPSRSSLTAPTAASLARAGAGSDRSTSTSTKTSPTAKSKPREVTKPINLPSHLTAPTASSRAKHEPEAAPEPRHREVTKPVNLPSHLTAPTASSRAKHEPESVPAPSTSTSRTTASSRPKATIPGKSAPRASLPARPASRDSTAASRKSTGPASSSFLDRMTKPTTSSANRTSDRHEVERHTKSKATAPPAKAASAPKAKVNGAKAAPKASAAAPVDLPAETTAHAETAEEESSEEPVHEVVSNESYAGNPASGIQHSAVTADTDSAGEALTFAEDADPLSMESEAQPAAKTEEVPEVVPDAEAEETAPEPKGNETTIPHTNGEEPDGSLEATPAAISDEETIR